ncbi:helix-turn-helix transcriptional regulator [Enterococcus hirae]
MITNVGKIDFFVKINGELFVTDKFIVSDHESLYLLQRVEDLPVLLRRGWLVHICPSRTLRNGEEGISVTGIDLVFREDLLVEPVNCPEEVFGFNDFIIKPKELGRRIKQIRLTKGIEGKLYLGIDEETIQRWEEGKEIPQIEWCMVLARMADYSLETFLYGRDFLG